MSHQRSKVIAGILACCLSAAWHPAAAADRSFSIQHAAFLGNSIELPVGGTIVPPVQVPIEHQRNTPIRVDFLISSVASRHRRPMVRQGRCRLWRAKRHTKSMILLAASCRAKIGSGWGHDAILARRATNPSTARCAMQFGQAVPVRVHSGIPLLPAAASGVVPSDGANTIVLAPGRDAVKSYAIDRLASGNDRTMQAGDYLLLVLARQAPSSRDCPGPVHVHIANVHDTARAP